MARTRTIPDEQILEAAREAFLEEGIHVSTAEIARRAGVAEGTLFSRYGTKEDLFLAAMGLSSPPFLTGLEARIGRGELEEELTELLVEMVDFFENALPCMMLVVSHGARHRFADSPMSPPARVIRGLSAYFEAEIRGGRLRTHDAEILARILIGSVWHLAFCNHVKLNDVFPMPRHTYVRGIVDLVLRGARAETKNC